MYQEVILDHYKHPHGRGLRDGDAEVHHVNPTCGDKITLRVKYDGSTIADVSYEGQGCSISQASASVLNDLLVGKELDEAQKIQGVFLELMQSKGKLEPDDAMEEVLEDAVAFAGVSKYPARVKCALLSWMAWKDATAQALGGPTAAWRAPRVLPPAAGRRGLAVAGRWCPVAGLRRPVSGRAVSGRSVSGRPVPHGSLPRRSRLRSPPRCVRHRVRAPSSLTPLWSPHSDRVTLASVPAGASVPARRRMRSGAVAYART
ncbi:hypothetical protein SALBM135S_10015 [Streptomyces alboniger]